MKDISHRWGIPALLCALAASVAAAPGAGAGVTRRDGAVAVVVTGNGTGWAELSISYLGTLSQARAADDIHELGRTAGWSLGAPRAATSRGATQATARVNRAGSSERLVWASVWALRRYSRITLAAVSPDAPTGSGQLRNRFVDAAWSGGGGLWSCDVTVRDRSFRTLGELTACSTEPEPHAAAAPSAAQASQHLADARSEGHRPALVVGVAAIAGLLAYVFAARSFRQSAGNES